MPAEHEQDRTENGHHDNGDRPLVVRRVVLAAGRVPVNGEQREPEHDHGRAADLPPADPLIRQEPTEREREDDRRHEQRLDHGEPPAIEGGRL